MSMELGTKVLSEQWGTRACHRLSSLLPEVASDRKTGSQGGQIPKCLHGMSWQEGKYQGKAPGTGLKRT